MKKKDSILVQRIVTLSSLLEPLPTGIVNQIHPLQSMKAVLFDVYGTLFISDAGEIGIHDARNDPTEKKQTAFRQACIDAGFRWLTKSNEETGPELLKQEIQQIHLQKKEQGIRYPEVNIIDVWNQVVAHLISQKVIDGEITRHSLKRLAVEYECRVNPVWPMPYWNEVLDQLKKGGLHLGIISNAQFYTPLMISAFLNKPSIHDVFDEPLCIWSYLCGQAKPSAFMFELACERLWMYYQVKPHEVLYIGNDMRNDIGPAAQVGFRTALFAGDRRSLRWREGDSLPCNIQPDCVITRLPDVMEMV